MGISEAERLRANYDRLVNLASEARDRGQANFADLLVDRASKYLEQIATLDKRSNKLTLHKPSQSKDLAKREEGPRLIVDAEVVN
jgi:hypothetical protein